MEADPRSQVGPDDPTPNAPAPVSVLSTRDDDGKDTDDDGDDRGHHTTNPVKPRTTITTKSKMASASSSSSTTTPTTSSSRAAAPPPASPSPTPATRDMINSCLVFLAILYVLGVSLMIFSGPRVLDTLLLFAIGLFPVFLILRFVHVHLRGNNDGNNEPDVHWSFLFNQFVLAAIPGTFIIVVVEMTIFAGLIYAFLGKELIAILQAYEESKNNTDVNSGDDDMSSENILASLPIWKLILVALGNAFIVAATVEEAVKWLFARRALTRHQHQQQDSHQSSSKSVYEILSSACVCGLGLAMVENNAYVLGLSTAKASGTAALISTNKSVFLIALRDVLAFPVHVGATLSIAVTAATNIVNDQLHSHSSTDNDDGVATPPPPKASVAKAWLTAVAYHGLFDGAAMVVAVLVAKKLLPSVMEGVVVALQAALVVAFSILLRARFRALIEREHAFVVQRTEQQQGRQQQQQIGQVGVEQRGDDGCV